MTTFLLIANRIGFSLLQSGVHTRVQIPFSDFPAWDLEISGPCRQGNRTLGGFGFGAVGHFAHFWLELIWGGANDERGGQQAQGFASNERAAIFVPLKGPS